MQACGFEVQSLKRVRIMNICLGGLPKGAYRKINGAEYKELLNLLKDSSSLSRKERLAGEGTGETNGWTEGKGRKGRVHNFGRTN